MLVILSKCKLDKLYFAHLSAYLLNNANINFDKFYLISKLFTKGKGKILPFKCSAPLVHNIAKKGCDLLIRVIHSEFYVTFKFLKTLEAINKILTL